MSPPTRRVGGVADVDAWGARHPDPLLDARNGDNNDDNSEEGQKYTGTGGTGGTEGTMGSTNLHDLVLLNSLLMRFAQRYRPVAPMAGRIQKLLVPQIHRLMRLQGCADTCALSTATYLSYEAHS